MEKYEAEVGTWKLVSPSGKEFKGTSPLYCLRSESEDRIPEDIRNKRLLSLLSKCNLCGEEANDKFVLAPNTPAEISGICLTCKNIIMDSA